MAIIAKAMLDNRLVDLPLSTPFLHLVQGGVAPDQASPQTCKFRNRSNQVPGFSIIEAYGPRAQRAEERRAEKEAHWSQRNFARAKASTPGHAPGVLQDRFTVHARMYVQSRSARDGTVHTCGRAASTHARRRL